jgi:O-antigen/teichoic acid export membrane protein
MDSRRVVMDSLQDKTYRGAFWSAVDAGGGRLVQFVIGVILARLLLPEQFGLIGMLAIFMAIAQSFLTSGFGMALIQKKEVTSVDASSVFYFNLVIGAVLAGLLGLAAPGIAAFYHQPVLSSLTRALSLVLVINSFAVVQTAMLTRNIDFKTQAKVSLLTAFGSGTVGIALAVWGFGVWSLVGQQLSNALFTASLLWWFNRWRPTAAFSFQALGQMFTFGSRILLSGLVSQLFDNIYYVDIGRLFSPGVLGYYTRAQRLEELPAQTLTQIVSRVSFPVFSSIHEDDARLKSVLKRALVALVFVNCPLMIGIAVTARPLVSVLLTEKWLPCVPYLQLLSVLGLLLPLHALNLNALVAKGHSRLFLRLEIVKKVLIVGSIAVTWRWGVPAMIWGQIAVSIPCYYLNSYYIARLVRYTVVEQLRDVSPYFACAALMGAALQALHYVEFPSDLLLLVAQGAGGVLLYATLCGVLRLSAFEEGRGIVGKRWRVVHGGVA